MPDHLIPEDLQRILGPIWQAEALALFRIDEALEALRACTYGTAHQRVAQLLDVRAYLCARLRTFEPDRFHQVIETISGKVLHWPPVVPTEAMKRAAVEELWTKRADLATRRQALKDADAQRLQAAQTKLQTRLSA
jgi:hypothetical protein